MSQNWAAQDSSRWALKKVDLQLRNLYLYLILVQIAIRVSGYHMGQSGVEHAEQDNVPFKNRI